MSDDEPNYNEARITIWSSQDMCDAVDERVNHGPPEYESRSQWVREAIALRMVVEDALDREGIELPDDDAARERYLRTVAQEGIAAADPPGETE